MQSVKKLFLGEYATESLFPQLFIPLFSPNDTPKKTSNFNLHLIRQTVFIHFLRILFVHKQYTLKFCILHLAKTAD